MVKLRIVLPIAAVIGAVALIAAAKGILHPELAVATGTYAQPAARIGQTPSAPWTQTTIDAGVDKQPQPGKVVTLTGEIIDVSCYMQLGKHGEKHRACGQKCVQNHQPIGLLLKDGAVCLLMPEPHDPRRDGGADLRAAAVEHMGHIVEVTGTETAHLGVRALFVRP
jgi:hypothetical protein